MTDEQIALSRRLVACKGWRWMPGALDLFGRRVRHPVRDADALPDLTDAATLGCLLALVRKAWGDPFLCPAADRETGWWLNGYAAVDYLQSYRSEAEALVAALESAP